MAKPSNDSKQHRATHDSTSASKSTGERKGRSWSCSMCIYTFVFVTGVFVATILPDLAGHHFKQPYGKEYGVMLEQAFKDLPQHMTKLGDVAAVVGRDMVDRFWKMKAEVDRRVADIKAQQAGSSSPSSKTKVTTQRPATKATTAATTTAAPRTTTTARPTTTTKPTTTTARTTTTTTTARSTTTTTTTTTQATTTTPRPTTTTKATTTTPRPTTTTTTTTQASTTTTQTTTTTPRPTTTAQSTTTVTTTQATTRHTTPVTHHDHVHTVRAHDTTKPTIVVTEPTVVVESTTVKAQEETRETLATNEL